MCDGIMALTRLLLEFFIVDFTTPVSTQACSGLFYIFPGTT
jgi:hypothetical protein